MVYEVGHKFEEDIIHDESQFSIQTAAPNPNKKSFLISRIVDTDADGRYLFYFIAHQFPCIR
jgi:hypothetical protein